MALHLWTLRQSAPLRCRQFSSRLELPSGRSDPRIRACTLLRASSSDKNHDRCRNEIYPGQNEQANLKAASVIPEEAHNGWSYEPA
jgi:hypothetical protein